MISAFIDKQNKFLRDLSMRRIVVFIILWVVIGQIVNTFFPHRFFNANQIILCVMLASQLLIIKKLDKECRNIKLALQQACEPEVVGLFSNKAESITISAIVLFISVVFVMIYIFTMFALGCLDRTITGLYGGLFGALVFYIGIQAYVKYISLSYFVYDLRNISIANYFFYFPALTNWFGKVAALFSFIEKGFLGLGVLYTTIYALNLPSNTVSFDSNQITLNAHNNILLFITWGGILLFFVMAFPILTFFTRGCIKHKICILKNRSIQSLEQKIRLLQDDDDKLDAVDKYLGLIKSVNDSADYPLKSSRTFFDSLYSILIALVTLVSPFISIFEGFIGKA